VNLRIIVNPVNDPPVITPLNDTSVIQGQWLFYTIDSNDLADNEPVETDLDLIQVIPGIEEGSNYMELPNGSFRLLATNEMVGEHIITVTATDGEAVVNTTFTIEVFDVNDPPLKPLIEITEGRRIFNEEEIIVFTAIADDPDAPWGDTLTFRWISSISGDLGSSQTLEVQLE
jgi:hypothetical protein